MKRYQRILSWTFVLPLILACQIGRAQELEKIFVGHSNIRNNIAAL